MGSPALTLTPYASKQGDVLNADIFVRLGCYLHDIGEASVAAALATGSANGCSGFQVFRSRQAAIKLSCKDSYQIQKRLETSSRPNTHHGFKAPFDAMAAMRAATCQAALERSRFGHRLPFEKLHGREKEMAYLIPSFLPSFLSSFIFLPSAFFLSSLFFSLLHYEVPLTSRHRPGIGCQFSTLQGFQESDGFFPHGSFDVNTLM